MSGRNLTIVMMALAVLLAGCGLDPAGSSMLQDARWVVVSLEGEPPLTGTAPSAEFSADEISGSAGCNTYFGSYTLRSSEMSISDVAHTEILLHE
jgi:heat shock protein HslJ